MWGHQATSEDDIARVLGEEGQSLLRRQGSVGQKARRCSSKAGQGGARQQGGAGRRAGCSALNMCILATRERERERERGEKIYEKI